MTLGLNGPGLNDLRDTLIKWAAETRLDIIKQLTDDYPYGAVKLSSLDQWTRFTEMQPQDYEALIAQLNDRYRGLPNAYELVNRDLAAFLSHMMTLANQAEGSAPLGQQGPLGSLGPEAAPPTKSFQPRRGG